MIVFIDSGVLGQICNPNISNETTAVKEWLFKQLSRGVRVVSSDICDYEVRRGLILSNQKKPTLQGIEKLDEIQQLIEFLPVDRTTLLIAAQLWADARSSGQPTADDRSLDADLIICATWQLLAIEQPGRYAIVATTNVKHLSRFAVADRWQNIN
jgi:predicted nucleic acid-binding protein